MRVVFGLVLGAAAGTALGFVVYLILRELVIPYALWSSDLLMWGIVIAVAVAGAVLGLRAGRASAMRSASVRGGLGIVAGVLIGLVCGAGLALLLAIAAAAAFDISQREGAYAMGVAFVYMPVGALIGAIAGAVIAMRRKPAARSAAH